jgi:hypothetical protein
VFAFEWLLRLIHSLSCWLVGRGLALDSVDFPSPGRPTPTTTRWYTERSAFIGGRVLTARFNATLLELPIRRDEAALASFLDGAPGRISMLYRRDRATVTRVRDLIRDALPASLSQDDVARSSTCRRAPCTAASTRKGRASAPSRRPCAATWPCRASPRPATPSPVAADLGYADTSAFYRAFTGWTGMSPERYRRQLAARRAARPAGTRPRP